MGGLFSLIFIGEYSSILFISMLTSLIFGSGFKIIFLFIFIMLVFLWVRASFPRLRYDKLMGLAWKGLIIFIIGVFSFIFFF
jgi:NADH:ubiquinone oxidoreductase subunit H